MTSSPAVSNRIPLCEVRRPLIESLRPHRPPRHRSCRGQRARRRLRLLPSVERILLPHRRRDPSLVPPPRRSHAQSHSLPLRRVTAAPLSPLTISIERKNSPTLAQQSHHHLYAKVAELTASLDELWSLKSPREIVVVIPALLFLFNVFFLNTILFAISHLLQ